MLFIKNLVLIILTISIYFTPLIAENSKDEILASRSSFFPNASFTCGIQNGFKSARVSLKYYLETFNFAGRYTKYDIFIIGTRPYSEGVILNHKEFSLTSNMIVYSPYSNVHCSLGSGLLYRIKRVRDERISYENWTSKNVYDFGLPIELNLENFLTPIPVVLNFGYKFNLFKEEINHTLFFDFGIYFKQK